MKPRSDPATKPGTPQARDAAALAAKVAELEREREALLEQLAQLRRELDTAKGHARKIADAQKTKPGDSE